MTFFKNLPLILNVLQISIRSQSSRKLTSGIITQWQCMWKDMKLFLVLVQSCLGVLLMVWYILSCAWNRNSSTFLKSSHTHTEFLGAEAVDIFSKSLASCLCTRQNFCLINSKISHTVLLCFSITGNTIALSRKKKYRRVQGFTVVRFIMQKIHPLHKFRNTAQGVLMQGQCSSRLPAAAKPLHSRGANLPRGKTGKSFACFQLIG